MSIGKDIQQAIDMNLTAEVAERLKEVLDDGIQAKIDLAVVEDDNAKMRTELERLRDLANKANLVASLREELEADKRELATATRVHNALAAAHGEDRNHIFELARIVFGCLKGVDDGPR